MSLLQWSQIFWGITGVPRDIEKHLQHLYPWEIVSNVKSTANAWGNPLPLLNVLAHYVAAIVWREKNNKNRKQKTFPGGVGQFASMSSHFSFPVGPGSERIQPKEPKSLLVMNSGVLESNLAIEKSPLLVLPNIRNHYDLRINYAVVQSFVAFVLVASPQINSDLEGWPQGSACKKRPPKSYPISPTHANLGQFWFDLEILDAC